MKGAINVMRDLKEICNLAHSCTDCPLSDDNITLCLESPRNWDDDDIQYIVKNAKRIKEVLTHEA